MNDLDPASIEASLSRHGSALGRPMHVLALTASTNDDAREAAQAGASSGTVIVADTQSAGRGRGDHIWHSPSGENLYVSIILHPKLSPKRMAGASLVVGVCVARVVERRLMREGRVDALGVKLKWPNDVLVMGKKISGVLIEGRLRGDEVQYMVVGVGVNIKTLNFPPELMERATSLALLGCMELDRADMLGELLAEIGRGIESYEREGLGAFERELGRLDALVGRRMKVGDSIGIARGIDKEGCILLETEHGGVEHLSSGEVLVLG